MSKESTSQALAVGHRVLWYEVKSVLGQGGFGITYRALDTNLHQPVALKEYLPSMFASRRADGTVAPLGGDQQADFAWGLARFLDEGRTLARFDHPGIARVHSVFEHDGTAYLVMRFEEGESLDSLLKQRGTLPEATIRGVLEDVMAGLEQVHGAGFIHRDIKPANIYLRGDGSAVLIDFGSARQALATQTQTLTTLVSPGYAPFEQYYSDAAQQGPWTDIYALGATAFRAMTGRSPMPAVDRSKGVLSGAPDFVEEALHATENAYSAPFRRAVAAALAFREQDRPQSIAAWRAMFDAPSDGSDAARGRPGAIAAAGMSAGAFAEAPTEVLEDRPTAVHVARTEVLSSRRPQEVPGAADTPAVTAAAAPAGSAAVTPRPYRRAAVLALPVVVLLALLAWRPWQNEGRPPPAPVAAEETATAAVDPTPSERPSAGEAMPAAPVQASRPQTPVAPAGAAPAAPVADGGVKRLLFEAMEDMQAGRRTRPRGASALDKYRQVLAREPGNVAARDGIERIVAAELDSARRAARDGRFGEARIHLDEAAYADPSHPAVAEARTALARLEREPGLTAQVIDHADKLLDEQSVRSMKNARKALRKQDYSRALDAMRKIGKD